VLERFDALVRPTAAITGFVVGDDDVDHGYTIGGVEHRDVPAIAESSA
jgi:hypothetical protein